MNALATPPAAFMGYGLDLAKHGKGCFIIVCRSCPGRDSVEAWAAAGGNQVVLGFCSKCAAVQIARRTGDSSLTGQN